MDNLNKSTNSLNLYFDGASRGNPGPAGAGVYIVGGPHIKIQHEKSKYLGQKTNNEAEYEALILGLSTCVQILSESYKADTLVIKGDSNLVLMQVAGKWKVRKQHLIPLYNKCLDILKQITDYGVNYRVEHIRRELNQDADRLANKAIDNQYDGLF